MSRFYSVFKWFIFVAAYIYLGYKLLTFNQYDLLFLQWKLMPLSQFWWLALVVALLPLNWLLEAQKWKVLCSKIQHLSIIDSYKAVLAGISTGFFTPNRIGEMVGRVIFLRDENRKTGVTLSLLNSLTQNIIMILCGIPATILFFNWQSELLPSDIRSFILLMVSCLLLFGLLYFALPFFSKQIVASKLSKRIASFTLGFSSFNKYELLQVLLISLLRYIVFCCQFLFMLRFFNVDLSLLETFIGIPATYLFVTFTPSLAFSEAAIRSSYAVFFLGIFSDQTVGIALSGICIWVVNFVLPMIVGSVIMVKEK